MKKQRYRVTVKKGRPDDTVPDTDEYWQTGDYVAHCEGDARVAALSYCFHNLPGWNVCTAYDAKIMEDSE